MNYGVLLILLLSIIYFLSIPYLIYPGKKYLNPFSYLVAQLFLFSFGLYAWRYTGVLLNIYTSLNTYPLISKGVEYHFPYSVGSVVFFAIIKHIYDFIKLRQAAQQLRIEKQQAELNYLKVTN